MPLPAKRPGERLEFRKEMPHCERSVPPHPECRERQRHGRDLLSRFEARYGDVEFRPPHTEKLVVDYYKTFSTVLSIPISETKQLFIF